MQRRFGKFLPRSADETQVGVLLNDFDEADKMLAKVCSNAALAQVLILTSTFQIIDAAKAWRDSWRDILGTQQRLAHGFQTMYSPIMGADESYVAHEPVITPRHIMERTVNFHASYDELRTDLLEEVAMVDTRIIKPAMEAKDCIQPMKKVIRKRGDKKVGTNLHQSVNHIADLCSWTLRNIKSESKLGGAKRRDRIGIMHLSRRLNLNWSEQKRYVEADPELALKRVLALDPSFVDDGTMYLGL